MKMDPDVASAPTSDVSATPPEQAQSMQAISAWNQRLGDATTTLQATITRLKVACANAERLIGDKARADPQEYAAALQELDDAEQAMEAAKATIRRIGAECPSTPAE
jgi:hypothetical protein